MKRVTLKDIAGTLNVSLATVSNVLNNIPGASERTRQKIIVAAFDMAYLYRSHAKPVTIYDIAKQLSLSAATINRALNGNKLVDEKTLSKIKKVAIAMGYVQNFNASALKKDSKRLAMEQHRVTIYDIANELNISAATVSRCLRKNCSASPATREKVLEKAKAMGFTINATASNLRTAKNYDAVQLATA